MTLSFPSRSWRLKYQKVSISSKTSFISGQPADGLEDLRYRWMLYKSKLKDSSHLLVGAKAAQVPGPGET